MKKYSFLFGFIALLSVSAIVWGFMKHSNLQARVNTLEDIAQLRNYKNSFPKHLSNTQIDSLLINQRDSLFRVIEMKTVKEEYYLTQMDIQSNWYITYVTLLFVLFSFIGFGVFKSEISHIIEQNRKDNEEQDERIHNFENKFVSLEGDLRTAMGTIYNTNAYMNPLPLMKALYLVNSAHQHTLSLKSQTEKGKEEIFRYSVMSAINQSLTIIEGMQLSENEIKSIDNEDIEILFNHLNIVLNSASAEFDKKTIRKLQSAFIRLFEPIQP